MQSDPQTGNVSRAQPSTALPLQVRLGNGMTCVLLPQDLPVAEAVAPLAQALEKSADPQERARLSADLSRALAQLGEVLLNRNQPAEAERLFREAIELGTAVLGPEHPHILAMLCRLGNSLANQSKTSEAEQIDRRALLAYQRTLGPHHVDTLTALNNLAGDLMAQGKTGEAAAMIEQSARTCQDALGPEHPATLRALGNFGAVLLQQGKLTEAEREIRGVLEVRRRIAGPAHPTTQQAGRLLVEILNRQQKTNEAAALQLSLGGKLVRDGCFAFILEPSPRQPSGAPYQPPAEVKPLLDEAIQLGLRQLEQQRAITPMCLSVTRSGARLSVPFEELCLPLLPSLASRLLPRLKEALPEHDHHQAALLKQVEYETGEGRTRHEALQITLEQEDGWAVVCYLPYRREAGRVVPGEMFAVNPLS
jgi:tetratricopeptide (TPR) repeat protein